MKIRNTQLKTKSLNIGSYSNEETSMEGVMDKKFADIMNDTKEQRAKEELTELLEEIRIQGEKLNKRLSLSEVIYFSKLVSRFLSRIVDGMLEFSKYDIFDHLGRHDVYAIIKTVDSKLDELVQEVAGSEKDTLKILTLTDDIRGLLVDLFY